MSQQIRFGTDGWRAVVARDFTFANLSRLSRATAAWLRHTAGGEPRVVVGHDARFMGEAFARYVAQTFAADGLRVILADGVTPTPAISWATAAFRASAGVVITASHNPAHYNGFKIKASFGGPATQAMTTAVEAEILPYDEDFDLGRASAPSGRIQSVDVRGEFLSYLRKKCDLDIIRDHGLRVAHDAMFGAGRGFFRELLGPESVVELHSSVNPGFDGMAPEPIERNLGALMETVRDKGLSCGIANDGDADRIGMVDEQGRMLTAHELMALLVKYLHRSRGLRGSVVHTFATSAMLGKMGRAYGLPVEILPIGFKYIAPRIVDSDVLVGGEESGGISLKGHIPERDGVYVGLVILEMMARSGKPLSALVQELFDEFGPHAYFRADLRTLKQPEIMARLRREGGLREIAGSAVETVDMLDGFKHFIADGWLLVRPSGTEPVLRIYAEAPSKSRALGLVEDVAAQLGITL